MDGESFFKGFFIYGPAVLFWINLVAKALGFDNV
jgi:hypothetical protein